MKIFRIFWTGVFILCCLGFHIPIHAVASVGTYDRNAKNLIHKVKKVTVYSDRALISRTAKMKKLKKIEWARFSMLPYQMVKNSLRAKILNNKRAEILQIITEDSFEHTALGPELDEKLAELKKYYGEKLDILQKRRLVQEEHLFIKGLKFDAPFSKSDHVYQEFRAPLSKIHQAMKDTKNQSSIVMKRLEKMDVKLKLIDQKITHILNQIRGSTSLSKQKWVTHVYLLIKNNGKKTIDNFNIGLSYMIKGAFWRPVYDIRANIDLKKGKADIQLITAGMVEQHTGENWNDIGMVLSTLDPIPLYLPVLDRWIFKETREEEEQEVFFDGNGSLGEVKKSRYMSKSMSLESVGVAGKRSKIRRKKAGRERKEEMAPSAMSEMKADFRLESDHLRSREMNRKLKRSLAPAKNNVKHGGNLSGFANFPIDPIERIFPEFSVVAREVDNLDRISGRKRVFVPGAVQRRPEKISYNDSNLPAVQAKGRLVELLSPFNVSLKSDEAAMKIPVLSQKLTGKLLYFAIPKKDKRVFLRAQTTNTTKYPILRGESQIFMDGDLLSKFFLNTTSEGSYFTIDLGVDKNVQTKRIVTKKAVEKGVLFKDHVTNVEVKIEIANHHAFPIKIELQDNYPLSPNDKIKVKLLETRPERKYKSPGIVSWISDIPANNKKIFSFEYQVIHPENYIVSELN